MQSFKGLDHVTNTTLLGAVGQLQFDVVLYRLLNEYNAAPVLEPAPFTLVRWFSPDVKREDVENLFLATGVRLALDIRDQLVILFPTKWALDYFVKEHPKLELHPVSPHDTKK